MILCADDYGISPAVSAGIIELIEEQRVSSVSCMVIGAHAATLLERLRPWRRQVEVGLHIVLTNDTPLTPLKPETGLTNAQGRFLSFPKLLCRAYQGGLASDAVRHEIATQLAAFEGVMGSLPDYLDGHQHVQQLPVIREAVVSSAEKVLARGRPCYVRVAAPPLSKRAVKRFCSSPKLAMGNLTLAIPGYSTRRLLDRCTIPHNRFLLGFYDYEGGSAFRDIFRLYLSMGPGEDDIFFCHSGYVDEELRQRDPLAASRTDALWFLQSSQCLELMEQRGVGLNTFFGRQGEEAPSSPSQDSDRPGAPTPAEHHG